MKQKVNELMILKEDDEEKYCDSSDEMLMMLVLTIKIMNEITSEMMIL